MSKIVGEVRKTGRVEQIQVTIINSKGQKCVDANLSFTEEDEFQPDTPKPVKARKPRKAKEKAAEATEEDKTEENKED